eukprot:12930059-Prorocentrum_lima.AAC.1
MRVAPPRRRPAQTQAAHRRSYQTAPRHGQEAAAASGIGARRPEGNIIRHGWFPAAYHSSRHSSPRTLMPSLFLVGINASSNDATAGSITCTTTNHQQQQARPAEAAP